MEFGMFGIRDVCPVITLFRCYYSSGVDHDGQIWKDTCFTGTHFARIEERHQGYAQLERESFDIDMEA
jgi:hypothetical protein